VRLTEEDREAIGELAQVEGVTPAEWVRQVVREALDEHRE
jgi:hypothetical protein